MEEGPNNFSRSLQKLKPSQWLHFHPLGTKSLNIHSYLGLNTLTSEWSWFRPRQCTELSFAIRLECCRCHFSPHTRSKTITILKTAATWNQNIAHSEIFASGGGVLECRNPESFDWKLRKFLCHIHVGELRTFQLQGLSFHRPWLILSFESW